MKVNESVAGNEQVEALKTIADAQKRLANLCTVLALSPEELERVFNQTQRAIDKAVAARMEKR